MGLRDAAHRRVVGGSTKLLGMLNLPRQGFGGGGVTKIEAHTGMVEWLVIKLAIEEALQTEINDTLEHNNQSYFDWCALLDKRKNHNKVKLTVTVDMG